MVQLKAQLKEKPEAVPLTPVPEPERRLMSDLGNVAAETEDEF